MGRARRILLGLQLAVLAAGVTAVAQPRAAARPAAVQTSSVMARTIGPVPVALAPVKKQPATHTTAPRRATAHRAPPTRRIAAPVMPRHAAAPVRPVRNTAQRRMELAVARIPGYPAGGAHWFLVAKDGFWGTADWHHGAIYISPSVPASRIYDVVAHEWAHLLSAQAYGDVGTAQERMNAYFGGSGFTGAERAADCIALALGAVWTHYTSCTDPRWQVGARELLSARRV